MLSGESIIIIIIIWPIIRFKAVRAMWKNSLHILNKYGKEI